MIAKRTNKEIYTKIKNVSISLGALWGAGSIAAAFALFMEKQPTLIWNLALLPQYISGLLVIKYLRALRITLGINQTFFLYIEALLYILITPIIGAAIGWLVGKVIVWALVLREKRNT